MSDSLNNKELVAVGHQFAKAMSADTPIIDMAKIVSRLAERLDCTTAALREMTKQRDALAAMQPQVIRKALDECTEYLDRDCIMETNGISYEDAAQREVGAMALHDALLRQGVVMPQGNQRDLSYPVDPQVAEYEKIMQQAVPDGWVAVPVEPTEDMIIAGFEAELREEFRDPEAWEAFEAMSGCEQAALRAKWCWAAMVAAAPGQEAE
ncbi:hypothetical protein [Leclercia sp. M50]|uniref:hypothetical protein n=1 Tax=Leclercia sp. M50 TaxID=3081258 RepID=UPI0030170D2E